MSATYHVHDHGGTWDEWYAGDGVHRPRWSGRPNGVLVSEVNDLVPGSALDVGCGEGADAIWLAHRGWRVTAIDPSRVALDRAKTAAREAGVEITWVHAGLLEMPGGTGVHDLVTAQYAVLPRIEGDAAIKALLAAVAPGGTLLVVHHEGFPAHAGDHGDHGRDNDAYVVPGNVAMHLDHGWKVEVYETRPSSDPSPAQAHNTRDVVLRARRLTGRS